MTRSDATFKRLRAANKKAMVGFFTAGHPNYDRSLATLLAAIEAGIDVLELGIPFSDPTADGPVIQQASLQALANGMTLPRAFDLVSDLRHAAPDTPIVLFSYYNPILRYGIRQYHDDAVAAGADGVLIVDLPPEESRELTDVWHPSQLHLIRLVAPTTTEERLATLRGNCGGFVYAISRVGVTGDNRHLDLPMISDYLRRVKSHTDTPVCVGFGISSESDVRALAPAADGVIVGSALVRLMSEHADAMDLPERVAAAVRALRRGFQA
jgi:tryptophan synthase alpha chain